jgi:hypothetical protein
MKSRTKSLVSTGTEDGDNVIRVRGFRIHQRDIVAGVMLLAIAIFMISIAVSYGKNSCNTSSAAASKVKGPVEPVKSDTVKLGATVPAAFVMGGGSEKLAADTKLRGTTREWSTGDTKLRGTTREWAKGIDDAFADVRRKVEKAAIDDAFANVRRKVVAEKADAPLAFIQNKLNESWAKREQYMAKGKREQYVASMLTDNQRPADYRNPNNNNQPGTMYKLEPGEQQVPPLYDLKFGYMTNGPQAGDFSSAKAERLRVERDQSEGDGSVFEGWEGGHQIKDGIAVEEWEGNKDWVAKKAEVVEPMGEVCDLFDGLFNSSVFPGSSTQPTSVPGEFQVKAQAGGCVDVGKYYEYVRATIAAQMGDKTAALPAWAADKSIDLGLDRLNGSLPGLRSALVVDCAAAPSYRLSADRSVVDIASGKTVQYSIPWPADGSTLLTHTMKL